MMLHEISAVNVYSDSALIGKDVAHPLVTRGNTFADQLEYDYWDHVDFIIDKAAENSLYMAMVPVWGSNVKSGHVTEQQAASFADFLADRYKDKPNIIWLNG